MQESKIKWWFLHRVASFFKVSGWGLQMRVCLAAMEMALMAKPESPLASPKSKIS